MAIFEVTQHDSLVKHFDEKVKAPYVYTQLSTLGGPDKASIIIKGSLDAKSKWLNDILHNSRYFMIRLDIDGTLELFAKHFQMPKLRKSTVASVDDAIAKINKYLASAGDGEKDTVQEKIASAIHEEEEAIASYRQEAKTLPPKAAKRFREIARDEVQHKQELKKLRQIY